jgi:alpha-beta hydrolase superfamily lysophospholipase
MGVPVSNLWQFSRIAISALAIAQINCAEAPAAPVRSDTSIEIKPQQHSLPICEWKDSSADPRAIVLAIHGMTLHGGTYDRIARELCSDGVLTIAPDMRGFGRCYSSHQSRLKMHKVDYTESKTELVSLLQKLRSAYPSVPIYGMGESLGANLIVWLSGKHPELLNGVILSSPCIKRYWNLSPQMVLDICIAVPTPTRQIRLKPYVDPFLSPNPAVVSGYEQDPLIRKTLSLRELLQSVETNRSTIKAAKNIPQTMPVLTVEGTDDRMYKPDSVPGFMAQIHSIDQRIFWAKDHGHLLLETSQIEPEVLETVRKWIVKHAGAYDSNANLATTAPNNKADEHD